VALNGAMKTTALVCTLAAFALVAACGGGGEATPPPAAPAPAPADVSSAAPIAPPAPTDSAAATASAAPPASAAPATAGPPAAPGAGDWDKWSHDQKLAYMKASVMPKMHDVFAGYDSAKYGAANCKTCHGKGADDGSFKMPNPDLPKLPKTPAEFKTLAQKKAKIFAFMKDKVEPGVAQLLGEQPYDMKTNTGFGCMGCHTQK
jgi:hypothetical protein